MYRIAYRSHANPNLTPADVAELVERARIKNQRLGITGLLAWSQQSFLQCIEGPQTAVQGLMNEIAADVRHQGVFVFTEGPVWNRLFDGWDLAFGCDSMGSSDEAISAIITRHLHSSPATEADWQMVEAFISFWQEARDFWILENKPAE